MKNNELITKAEIPNIVAELEFAFFDIPFGNSEFQNLNFVVNASLTPERAYRNIGLAMSNKLQALKEAQYGRALEDIDIEELEEKIADPNTDKYERRRHEITLQKKFNGRKYGDKLINDAIVELTTMYRVFKQLPRYTRAEFEKNEAEYYKQSLTNQVTGVVGAVDSLKNMGLATDNTGKKCDTLLDQLISKPLLK